MTFLNSGRCRIDRVAKSVVHDLITVERQQRPTIKRCMRKQKRTAIQVIFEPLQGVDCGMAVSYRYRILQHRSWNFVHVIVVMLRIKVKEGIFRIHKNEAKAQNSR